MEILYPYFNTTECLCMHFFHNHVFRCSCGKNTRKTIIHSSYEGILARYSGLTKDNVIAVLDFFEVQEWLAQYDPTDFAPSDQKR